ncbi:pantothenate synthase [Dimargaris cristalligena]|uniref:Pantoate--beta-alanine ligase n=1 Tax=Dimargaris cristalligena TaxID=215637 RepID=A0A4P9ZRI6_9FUNG|nr:pantothenate synthase [Dimargaris cristalligena]|eukprot:RKP36017.1 pantothenate synthase [Dimargaris cristalligena]
MSTTGSPVLVFHRIAELRAWRREQVLQGRTIGFVPTMGALHEGHLNLVRAARSSCDRVVVSIFVNPAQFAPHEDLHAYPRTLDRDVALLTSASAHVVFAPTVAEMYPSGITLDVQAQRGTFLEVLGKSHQMEGDPRPHFFRGVATVVLKLLNAVQPDRAYFGQKDAQQCVVVKTMVRDLLLPVEIVTVPTTRAANQLALSSRNKYLSPDQIPAALTLQRSLAAAQALYEQQGERNREALLGAAQRVFDDQPDAQLEYLSLAHPETLDELEQIGEDGAIISGAFRVGSARLIDNILLGCTL